ncbi:MAG TPA: COX15/CtaA family protein [Candidatus Baltobacterales bacterium]|nr:COX15/CtaA family protein [Candidatus Baltobacterales bacterium]
MLSVVFFRRLAFVTALFAYLQIALGGLVRVSGSGLGCPDWPLCHGRPYPPANIHSIIEYSHRTVGSITGVLIIATVVLAWLVFRQVRPLVAWIASASLVAIAAEGGLGALVVANALSPWLVVVHLGLAMLILGCLVATAVMSLSPSAGAREPSFTRLLVLASAATYVMLLTGSTVVASSADQRCNTWPLCGSGFTPSFAGVDAFTMLHRGVVLLVSILLVYVLVQAMRRPGLSGVAIATLVVLALQIAVGAGAALTDGALFNGLHVAMATLVWTGILSSALLTLPRADRAPAISLSAEKTSA